MRNDVLPEHPHACGEIRPSAIASTMPFGTSPRVWGNQLLQKKIDETPRNIPTRVGKSAMYPLRILRMSEHPHACGEIKELK